MFIVIDGIDGCGKSTQVKLLAGRLEEQGKSVVTSKWKDSAYVKNLYIGDLLKRFQDGTVRIPPEARTFLLAADISNRLEATIRPALKANRIVIGDRYIYKIVAQGIARGLGKTWLDGLFSFAPKPDLTILLDIDPQLAAERIMAYREISYYEAGMDVLPGDDRRANFVEFQRRVRDNLRSLGDHIGAFVLDAGRPIERQHEEIAGIVERHHPGARG
jgi:dTMP kinase